MRRTLVTWGPKSRLVGRDDTRASPSLHTVQYTYEERLESPQFSVSRKFNVSRKFLVRSSGGRKRGKIPMVFFRVGKMRPENFTVECSFIGEYNRGIPSCGPFYYNRIHHKKLVNRKSVSRIFSGATHEAFRRHLRLSSFFRGLSRTFYLYFLLVAYTWATKAKKWEAEIETRSLRVTRLWCRDVIP